VPNRKSAIQPQQHISILSLGMLRLSRKKQRISRNLPECKKMTGFIESKPQSIDIYTSDN